MKVTLCNNASEVNAMTKNIIPIAEYTGEFRTEVDIVNPVITLDVDADTITSANYFTIDELGRSYFLNPPKWISGTLWEISGHVDVLASFRDEILANKAIVRRNANKYNLYLDDGDFRIYQKPLVKTKEFTSGFAPNSSTYVLMTAGNN